MFFCKRTKRSCVLLRSLQENVAFFAFFSILCKRMLRFLHSFLFFRKERKKTERSFVFHKSPKTRKKNGKERNVPFKERKRTERTERKRTRCPTLALGWSDFSFLWNFEKKQVGIVTFGKKNMFS